MLEKGETMNTEFEKAYEAAQRKYADINARMAALPPEDKALMKKIEAVKTGRYGASMHELMLIRMLYQEEHIDAIFTSFKYGFLKGQRAAKAEMKRKAKK